MSQRTSTTYSIAIAYHDITHQHQRINRQSNASSTKACTSMRVCMCRGARGGAPFFTAAESTVCVEV
eukprot:scaffold7097_cov112-Isochrysis_galbana.AAC.4